MWGALAAALGAGKTRFRATTPNKGRGRRPRAIRGGPKTGRPRPVGGPKVGPKAPGPRRKPTRTINTGTGRGPKRPIGRGQRPPKRLTTSQAAIRRFEARRRGARRGINTRR